jgi:hypothetical protein
VDCKVQTCLSVCQTGLFSNETTTTCECPVPNGKEFVQAYNTLVQEAAANESIRSNMIVAIVNAADTEQVDDTIAPRVTKSAITIDAGAQELTEFK